MHTCRQTPFCAQQGRENLEGGLGLSIRTIGNTDIWAHVQTSSFLCLTGAGKLNRGPSVIDQDSSGQCGTKTQAVISHASGGSEVSSVMTGKSTLRFQLLMKLVHGFCTIRV